MRHISPKKLISTPVYASLLLVFSWISILPGESAVAVTNPNIVINEISSASDPEWVELYNAGDKVVDIGGWVIQFDDDSTSQQFTLADSMKLQPYGFEVVEAGRYWLSNGGDEVRLFDADGNLISRVAYGNKWQAGLEGIDDTPKTTESIGRAYDGADTWGLFATPTPLAPNDPEHHPASEPTSTPTPTPTLFSTPTPTLTNAPTPLPTTTPQPTPVLTEPQIVDTKDDFESTPQTLSATTLPQTGSDSLFRAYIAMTLSVTASLVKWRMG